MIDDGSESPERTSAEGGATLTSPAASGSASGAASRIFRPRPAFWWRSAASGLALFTFLGWFVIAKAAYYQEIAAAALTAWALWWLYGLIRQVRRATLTLSPQGFALGSGQARGRVLEGARVAGEATAARGAPLPWAELRSKGIREEGNQKVLELATLRLGLIVPGAFYDLPALERALRGFGVREAAPGSPEASWPDEALLRAEAEQRLLAMRSPLCATEGFAWKAGWLTGIVAAAALTVAAWRGATGQRDVWPVLVLAGAHLLVTLLCLLFHERLEVTSEGLSVRSRLGGHGARWDQVTGLEVGPNGSMTIVAEQGWFRVPDLGSLRGSDAQAIRQAFKDVGLLRGIRPSPAKFRGIWSKGTRLPRGK